jgi:ABC-type amino acid transport system permease subunit
MESSSIITKKTVGPTVAPLPQHLDLDEQDEATTAPLHSSLTTPLQVLFFLNGATLSLPSTALMYIVNTRAQVPLVYLSIYGALAFLPNSLKPLYAYLSDFFPRRDALLTVLLILSGISYATTALVPTGGVMWCFVSAMVREVFSAWPEFLLGVTLLEQAQQTGDFDSYAAVYQSQAATARNVGSLLARMVGFCFFLYRHYVPTDGEAELSEFAVNFLLIVTGLANLAGAAYASYCRVGANSTQLSRYTRLTDAAVIAASREEQEQEQDVFVDEPSSPQQQTRFARSMSVLMGDATLIILLQVLVILFAMRGPVVKATSVMTWDIILSVLTAIMLLTIGLNYNKWNRPHRVGLFLIVRHAIPSSMYMLSSFIYSLFQSTPVVIQLFGLFSGGITSLSSWSYGKVFASYSSGDKFLGVIAVTTLVASLLSLLDIFVVSLDSSSGWKTFGTIIAVSLFTTFSREWYFLPSVVLATTAVNMTGTASAENEEHLQRIAPLEVSDPESGPSEPTTSYQQTKVTCCECGGGGGGGGNTTSVGMQYGALVSCLDFGDQIGSWLTMPLVAALGISRENDWENMNTFIVVTALLNLIPLALLPILRK